jgi:SAM-dependent methyltransferase
MSQQPDIDYQAVTARQKEVWASGDFHEIARQNVIMAEALCAAVDPHGGERELDIACGSGTAALVAARRYCAVTGIDYVPALVERAGQRAAAEGFDVDFRLADAQALPFPDASFDVVLSVYGVQFAPDQARAAAEMLRVCRPGGRIGLATPMPKGWSGDFFATNARYMPPPPGLQPPLRWEDRGWPRRVARRRHPHHRERGAHGPAVLSLRGSRGGGVPQLFWPFHSRLRCCRRGGA